MGDVVRAKKAIVDNALYSVVCAGVRSLHASRVDAIASAQRLIGEWSGLGYRRHASIYYRDGSFVAEVSASREVTS